MAKKLGGLGKGLNAIFMENDAEDNNRTVTLKLSEIEPNKNQPRQDFDETALAELAESISKHGLLQPILVRPIIGGGYQIVAGERRYRASRMAGLSEVPVIIRELSESETMEIALIENLQRENLTPIEEAVGYRTLMDEHGFSQEEASKAVGKSRSAVANSLRLLKLPEDILKMVSDGVISAGHARAILSLEKEEDMLFLANEIAKRDLSVRQAEKLSKKMNQAEKEPPAVTVKASYFSEVELALTEYLGKKVSVSPLKNKEGGILQIEFYSDEELKELANKLEDKR